MDKECLQVIVEIGESPKDGLPGMFTCCNGLITGMLRSANSELTPFYGMTLSHGVENITHDDWRYWNKRGDALKLELTQNLIDTFFWVLWFVLNRVRSLNFFSSSKFLLHWQIMIVESTSTSRIPSHDAFSGRTASLTRVHYAFPRLWITSPT